MDTEEEKGKVVIQLMRGGKICGQFSYKNAASKEKAIAKGLARVLYLMGPDINPWDCLYDKDGKRL